MSYYPIRIVKDPTLIINSNEIIKGTLEANEIDLISGGNLDLSSLSIDNTEIIDSSRNIKNINLMSSLTLESNTLNYFDSITLEDISGNNLILLNKHGIGTCAKLDIFDTSSGTPIRRVHLSSNPAQNSYIKNPFTFSETNTGTDASSQLEVHSTSKGFLPPRMTQNQKLAISSPAQGLEVYDTTINSKSYYNGINWFVPSYISFKLLTQDVTPSTIAWDDFTTSTDARISYNAGTGIFSFSDYGTYEINCTVIFNIIVNAPERNIQLLFINNTTSVTHTQVSTSIGALIESGNTYVSASMSPLLIVDFTTGLNFRFEFQSFANNTIRLSSESHGFIKRIL
jgi:hypothetical protein